MKEFYNENKEYYERNASSYENSSWYFFNRYKHKAVDEEINKCLVGFNSRRIKVLEIGPGTGYLLSKLVKQKNISFEYYCVEHSEEMGSILLSRYKDIIPIKIFTKSASLGFLEDELKEMKFDLIIGSSILHHLPDYEKLIPALSELLNKNGIMYFVREPIHKDECVPSGIFKSALAFFYEKVNNIYLTPRIRKKLWPEKVKQENPSNIAIHMFNEGVASEPFYKLTNKNFVLIFRRKYNRRASSFFSFLENKWLSPFRKDIFGNTLFSIAIKKIN